jgi:hypothetical protein
MNLHCSLHRTIPAAPPRVLRVMMDVEPSPSRRRREEGGERRIVDSIQLKRGRRGATTRCRRGCSEPKLLKRVETGRGRVAGPVCGVVGAMSRVVLEETTRREADGAELAVVFVRARLDGRCAPWVSSCSPVRSRPWSWEVRGAREDS